MNFWQKRQYNYRNYEIFIIFSMPANCNTIKTVTATYCFSKIGLQSTDYQTDEMRWDWMLMIEPQVHNRQFTYKITLLRCVFRLTSSLLLSEYWTNRICSCILTITMLHSVIRRFWTNLILINKTIMSEVKCVMISTANQMTITLASYLSVVHLDGW
jgi:hypothetical protein